MDIFAWPIYMVFEKTFNAFATTEGNSIWGSSSGQYGLFLSSLAFAVGKEFPASWRSKAGGGRQETIGQSRYM